MTLFMAWTVSLALAAAAGAISQGIKYPLTRKSDQVDDYHGTRIADPYRWLEDTESAETRQWIEAENRVTFGQLQALPERARVHERLTRLYNYEKFRPPFKEAGRTFYFHNTGLQNQYVLFTQSLPDSESRSLLDPNGLSTDGTISLSSVAVSHDGRMLAYGLSSGGSDWQEFQLMEIESGEKRHDHLKWIKNSGVAWTQDSKGFFYTRYPEPPPGKALRAVNRDAKLYYHRLGADQAEDTLVYAIPEHPDWGIGASVTEDGRYVTFQVYQGTDPRNRVYVKDLKDTANPDLGAPVMKLLDEFDAAYHVIGNDGPVFYFRTDLDAPRGRVISIDLTKPEKANWKTILPQSQDTLQFVRLIGDRLVAQYLHNAHSRLVIKDLHSSAEREVTLTGIGTISELTGKRRDSEVFFAFTSFLQPPTIYRCNVETGRAEAYRAPRVDFDSAQFETKQVWYKSKDGTAIPMFISHRKGLKLSGNNPAWLYGYGGFNQTLTPAFSLSALIWMENGGVYAVPNLRGGGEFGQEWHKAGTLERKQNVFDYFIAAAEYLVREKYTSPQRLAIAGGSNGGLLVGACMIQRPDLFAVALPTVGVMDMLRYDKFTIGWMWKSDYGSSDDAAQFRYLYAYSPLHNLKLGTRYPATLVTTGDHDDRVVPGHSFKFAAALQAAQSGENPTLIRIETRAGHGAGKPTTKIIDEAGDILAFALHYALNPR